MTKKKKIKENKDKLVKSINKNVRSSTRKLNPILKALVGKKVEIALRDLTFSEKRISKDIKKTISSAVANAENNFQYNIDKYESITIPMKSTGRSINLANTVSIIVYEAWRQNAFK